MTLVTKTISVTEQQDNWIKAQMKLGNRNDESEFIREMIEEFQLRSQESEQDIAALREALLKGERSGRGSRTPQEIKDSVIRRFVSEHE